MQGGPNIVDAARSIEEDFALFDDWRDKVEYLIDLGRGLPALPDAQKTEANKVRGCQSQVWMVASLDQAGRLHLGAESDAVLVKGLIALLLRLYDGQFPRDILDHPPEVLERVGLQRFLTPGRANGLYAMVGRIRSIAEAYASATAPA